MTIINPIVNQKKKGKLTQKKYLKTKECKLTKEELEAMDEFDRRMATDKKFHDYIIEQCDIALEGIKKGRYYTTEELFAELEEEHKNYV